MWRCYQLKPDNVNYDARTNNRAKDELAERQRKLEYSDDGVRMHFVGLLYLEYHVGALTESRIVRRVDGCLFGETRVKLRDVIFTRLQQHQQMKWNKQKDRVKTFVPRWCQVQQTQAYPFSQSVHLDHTQQWKKKGIRMLNPRSEFRSRTLYFSPGFLDKNVSQLFPWNLLVETCECVVSPKKDRTSASIPRSRGESGPCQPSRKNIKTISQVD